MTVRVMWWLISYFTVAAATPAPRRAPSLDEHQPRPFARRLDVLVQVGQVDARFTISVKVAVSGVMTFTNPLLGSGSHRTSEAR